MNFSNRDSDLCEAVVVSRMQMAFFPPFLERLVSKRHHSPSTHDSERVVLDDDDGDHCSTIGCFQVESPSLPKRWVDEGCWLCSWLAAVPDSRPRITMFLSAQSMSLKWAAVLCLTMRGHKLS